jgi:hypothetical protein
MAEKIVFWYLKYCIVPQDPYFEGNQAMILGRGVFEFLKQTVEFG